MGTCTHQGLSVLCLVGLLTGCANDHLTDSIKSKGPKAGSIVRVAQMTAARGDWPTAATLFKRAHNLDVKNFDAAYGLGRSLNRLNANEEALSAYRQALTLRPKNTDAMRGLGNTLVFLDRSALAIPHFERALALKEDPRLFNGIGVALDMLDDYKAAQAFYRVGLKTTPNDPSLRNNLALSLLLSGKAWEAAKLLRELSAHPGATTRHRLNFSLSLVLSGDIKMAERVARMDLDPMSADEHIAYFETIKSLGKTKEARAAIRAHIRGTSNEFMHPRQAPLRKMPN